MKIEDAFKAIAEMAVPGKEIDFEATDLDRIYFKDTDLFIRLWNLKKDRCNYTVYEPVEDRAIEIKSGCMWFEINEDNLIEIADYIHGLGICKKHLI